MHKPKNPRVFCRAALSGDCAFGNSDGTCDHLFELRKKCYRGCNLEMRGQILLSSFSISLGVEQ